MHVVGRGHRVPVQSPCQSPFAAPAAVPAVLQQHLAHQPCPQPEAHQLQRSPVPAPCSVLAQLLPRLTAVTLTAAASSPEAAPASSNADLEHSSKVVGCLLAAMCGNVLATPFEYQRHYALLRQFPDGVKDFWKFDLGKEAVPYGTYNGDFVGLISTAACLAAEGHVNGERIAADLAASYTQSVAFDAVAPETTSPIVSRKGRSQQDTGTTTDEENMAVDAMPANLEDSTFYHRRRFSPYEQLVCEALAGGSDPALVPTLAETYLNNVSVSRNANSTSDRSDREPFGANDYGAASRTAPVGLAYRNASQETLLDAVFEAAYFSHTQPVGLDAAFVMAAAVAWMSKQQPGRADCTSQALLDHLIAVARTADVRGKLTYLRDRFTQVGVISSWRKHVSTRDWHNTVRLFTDLTFHGYATAGSEAVAVALLCVVTNWGLPEQAIVTAATLGGSSPATAQMTGALVGALHGHSWLPSRWLDNLENGLRGREDVESVAERLASLDCKSFQRPGSQAAASEGPENAAQELVAA